MIKIFRGEGVVDGEGCSSEGCLKWGGGVIKGSFQKHLKTGMIINSGQKDVEVFCVALVTYKLTIIQKINDPCAKYVNLKKKF